MRICLLKANGVSVLDKAEAEEVKLLRESREKCGCRCQGNTSRKFLKEVFAKK